MKKIYAGVLLLGLSLQAQDTIAVTAKYGTLGFGIDTTFKIQEPINVRFNINKGSLNWDASDSDLISDGSFDLQSAGVLVDYHPMQNGFRLSSGIYYNGNELEVRNSKVKNNVKVGSHYYDFTKDTKTNINIETNSVAPYIGIGWGNAINASNNWTFSLDVGLLYQGKVKSKVNMTGTAQEHESGNTINLTTDNQFLKDIKDEKNFIDNHSKAIEWYPVVSLGVSYSF